MMTGRSLPPGCRLCHRGAKMVLFITGTCRRTCWYCPLSKERKGKDVVFANERRISDPSEAVFEAGIMSALGTGITGGEPLDRLDRVRVYARALKEEFGASHQIHLYTGNAPSGDELTSLAGLVDEIRMHPPHEAWENLRGSEYMRSADLAREMGFSVGMEVPALPGIGKLESVLPLLDFLNINELEWGETNAGEMRRRGFVPVDGMHNAVNGAREWARPLFRNPVVHWCSSRFKDTVQLRKRLLRTARNTARPFDEVTTDGTVVYGLLENGGEVPSPLIDLGREMYEVREGGVETAWWVLADHAEELPGRKFIMERYPNRGIVVEVTPLR